MKVQLIVLFFCLQCVAMNLFAQKMSPLITIGKAAWNLNEPSVKIHPENPNQCWVSTNNYHVFFINEFMESAHSVLSSTHGAYGDLVLYPMLESRKMACVHLGKNEKKERPEAHDRIVFQKQRKGLFKWTDGVGIGYNGKMQDKPWMYQDHQVSSPFYKRVYVSWTEFDRYESTLPQDSSRIKLAFSDNEGESFSDPVVLSDRSGACLDDDSTLEGVTVASGKKGELYAVWAGWEKLFLDQSLDGGKTWGQDQVIGQIPQGWDLQVEGMMRTNGMPFLTIDSSGYLFVITAFKDSSRNKVFFTRSTDSGKHWEAFFPLQSDKETDYVCPHACIDPITNTYYVLYYKIKAGKVDVLLSYKLAQEEGFHTIQVSDEAFALDNPTKFLGDYIAVDAFQNEVAIAWTALEQGFSVVKFRRLKF